MTSRPIRLASIALAAALVASPRIADAAPRFSRGTAIPGIIAYQDSETPTQFWYLPTSIPVQLGGSLEDFGVKYWGVAQPFRVKTSDGFWRSSIGATIAGRARADINAEQREALVETLRKTFGVANPALLPLPLKNVHVQPVLARSTLGLGEKDDVDFPSTLAIPATFSFVVGSGQNRLFAQYVATEAPSQRAVVADPSFAVNVVGEAEFVGDPWVHNCRADLSQVWNKVRAKVSVGVQWGWFRIGSAQYESIVQDLTRSGAITCDWKEGSLDTEKYGRQLFELTKEAFQALNAKAADGQGFFKFEPNPEPAEIGSGSSGWWPWSVSINGGYSSAHFKQTITWEQKATYEGRFPWTVPMSMVLAVKCNGPTAKLFTELGNSVPCITQAKADSLQARVEREAAAQGKRLAVLLDRLMKGEITPEQYEKIYAILGRTTITEDLMTVAKPELRGVRMPSTALRHLTDADLDDVEAKVLEQSRARLKVRPAKATR